MRKYQQKTILEYLNTLKEAHIEIPKNSEFEILIGLLADCQDFALVIGNYIDDIKGEGTHTVSLLEKYCELLYEISLNIKEGEIEYTQLELLDYNLNLVVNSVMEELKPNRIEVVFLSYKASMSDSIESIYFAAKADPNCDAYWIPIPYYEFESKVLGKVKKMCFEGADFYNPDIECFDWELYDIEKRHPDVVITNNPFDAMNQVTSVHPAFYCERLRNYTDLLVYVPYFVTSDEVKDQFCLLPGCKYAHMVIVQSDSVRKKYIETYQNAYGSRFGNPDEKFVALGSPKFDKLYHSMNQCFDIPEKWTNLLKGRKVILYNTSLHGLLEGGRQYLLKLRHVIKSFQNRHDIVLWWRPHPLSEATYIAMQPDLLREYQCIIEEYINEGWGIFDDSADLHRAIALTDAYYGDESSLVSMYLMVCKPVLIQNYEQYDANENNQVLIFENLISVDDDFWITPINFNSLFRINKQTMRVEHICIAQNEKLYQWRQYLSMVYIRNKIFFAPFSAKNIAVYSMIDGTYDYIEIPTPSFKITVKYNSDRKFSQILHYKNCLILIPNTYPGIIVYDLFSNKSKLITDWIILFEQYITDDSLGYFYRGVIVEDILYLACSGANAVITMNLETYAYEMHLINNNNVGYSGICFDGECFWLLPATLGSIIKWNYTHGVLFEYDEYINDFVCEKYFPFQNISLVGQYIWVLAALGNKAYKINTKNNEVKIADEFQTELNNIRFSDSILTQNNFILQTVDDDSLLAYSARSNRIILYENKKNNIKYYIITISNNDYNKIVEEQVQRMKTNLMINNSENDSDCIFYESFFSINKYMDVINSLERDNKYMEDQKPSSSLGNNVYNKIIESISFI
ncbi:MAG: CDP-glycerol glycerophosphotransferase family protein [Oscillospiraceae bacterium]|nr:CDP-glycerol glycerophosphotransferase family protein [Oscillospiraceae bacterium]